MTFFEHQCVKQDDTILSALAKLDKLSGQAMVVFVQNRKEQVIGTLTDGDIRRALLRGLEPSANVCDVMKTEFAFLKTDENDHTLTICDFDYQICNSGTSYLFLPSVYAYCDFVEYER